MPIPEAATTAIVSPRATSASLRPASAASRSRSPTWKGPASPAYRGPATGSPCTRTRRVTPKSSPRKTSAIFGERVSCT
ncbi:hypothetical protein NQP46_16795 [Streptomyces albus]|nr:hypothetical protein NQP46_16795 [Streptomyces albus]